VPPNKDRTLDNVQKHNICIEINNSFYDTDGDVDRDEDDYTDNEYNDDDDDDDDNSIHYYIDVLTRHKREYRFQRSIQVLKFSWRCLFRFWSSRL
jgi:hypothetical protein